MLQVRARNAASNSEGCFTRWEAATRQEPRDSWSPRDGQDRAQTPRAPPMTRPAQLPSRESFAPW
eukprot:1995939-Rhodomonas_salina.1